MKMHMPNTTMHCQNWGRTLELQLHLITSCGLGRTLSNKLFGNFIFIFINNIATGADVFQISQLRQCKTLAASIKFNRSVLNFLNTLKQFFSLLLSDTSIYFKPCFIQYSISVFACGWTPDSLLMPAVLRYRTATSFCFEVY